VHILRKSELLSLIEKRRSLFDAQENPFASSGFLLHFVEQVGREDWRYIVPEYRIGGESLMLLYERPENPTQIHALTNYYCSLYSPLVTSTADRREALRAIFDQLASHRAVTVNLQPLSEEDSDLVRHSLPSAWYGRRYFAFGNWYLPCAGLSFEQYMADRPSQLVNTWKRKAKKFTGELEIITGGERLEAGVKAWVQVYANSWKVPEPYPDFVPGWIRICAREGWLRLGVAWLDGQPIAAQFWLVRNRRAYIFKLAYDEAFKRYSAGTLLSAALFRHVLDVDRVSEVDYLSGDDAYKRDWVTHRRERVGVIACRLSSPLGLLIAARQKAGAIAAELRRRKQVPVVPSAVHVRGRAPR